MSSPLHADSREKRIQVETREEAMEALRERDEAFNWCRCAKPLRRRRYFRKWVCVCGKLVR